MRVHVHGRAHTCLRSCGGEELLPAQQPGSVTDFAPHEEHAPARHGPSSWSFGEFVYLEEMEILSHKTLKPSDPLWLRKQEVG